MCLTLCALKHNHQRAKALTFSALGIPSPLFVGPPDDAVQSIRDSYLCVVDEIPTGIDLASAGVLTPAAGIALCITLCDVVASWATAADGYILRGLRPETIFVSDDNFRRFTSAVPRPYFLLGNENAFNAYPDVSFDPPLVGRGVIEVRDAVFTVALLVWWAIAGVQAWGDADRLAFRFSGPDQIGRILERALVVDRPARTSLDTLRAELASVSLVGIE